MSRKPARTIFRIEKVNNYTPIHRWSAEDTRLSWEARGLLIFLLVKPDDWEVLLAHLINSSPAKKDKVRRIIQELIRHNYIVKKEVRGESGRFSAPEYIVYELPHDGYFDSLLGRGKTTNAVSPSCSLPSRTNPLLLNKQTKPSKQRTNKTTTNRLIWPPKLNIKHKESIMSLVVDIDLISTQLLLDELSGQIENINNPVGYFRTLLKSHIAGEFIPAKAIQTQDIRETRHKNAQTMERSERLSKERFQLQTQELRKDG